MKRFIWILGLLVLTLVPVMAVVNSVNAQRFTPRTEEDQKIYSSLYSTGKTIDIKGEIFGDVFCAGQQVTINAVVHGDVICTGQDLTVNGMVDGDIRLAGQAVAVGATIGQNASIAARDFSLDADAKVGQDVSAVGSMLTIKGAVGRDVTLSGAEVIINGHVGRNVLAQSSHIQVKADAVISGDLNYAGSVGPQVAKESEVKGTTHKVGNNRPRNVFAFNPLFYLFVLLSLTLICMFLLSLFPRYFHHMGDIIQGGFGHTLLVGFVAAIGVPLLAFIFATSLVGVPLALVMMLALALGAFLSGPIVAGYAGRLLLKKKNGSPVLLAMVGTFVVVTLYFIPVFGLVLIALVYWLGLGALVIDLYRQSAFARRTSVKPKE